jgi:predicted house-cleaning noncanonical NTP pyrophosphatase (MazG superfamily)
MTASKQEIRGAAKERHPNAVNIRMEAKEDFNIPGIADEERPGIRVIVNADGRDYVYEADTRDELLAKLVEKGKSATEDTMTDDQRERLITILSRIEQRLAEAKSLSDEARKDETRIAGEKHLAELCDALERVEELLRKDNQ